MVEKLYDSAAPVGGLAADWTAFDVRALMADQADKPIDLAPAKKKSYLETGVSAVTSVFVSDEATRDTISHYGSEFLKTAALFAGRKVGVVGTIAMYGLAQASPHDKWSDQAKDFALGGAQGGAMKGLFHVIGSNVKFAPAKGVLMGMASRGTGAVLQRDLFTDPGMSMSRLRAELLNPQAMLFDAAVFTVGEGLVRAANGATSGALSRNPLAGGMVTGASFGVVNGGSGELMRQQATGEDLDIGAIIKKGLLQGAIDAGAAAAGMKATSLGENFKVPVAAPPESRIKLVDGNGKSVVLSDDVIPLSKWRNRAVGENSILNGETTISAMAPLLIGDPHNPKGAASKAAWEAFDRDLHAAKKLGVQSVSTDVWWGLVEPKNGTYSWNYYDKVAQHITAAGLKWVPILSFHQCGGNVGDNVNVPVPQWVWGSTAAKAGLNNPDAVKFRSEQGNTSSEYVSFWATPHVLADYAGVMRQFQQHFAPQAKNIAEVNVSLGPAGELRYPSYNAHDKNAGWPTRGALQSYSELAQDSFRKFAIEKYGSADATAKAWGLGSLKPEEIRSPSDPNGFFERGDHKNIQYGRDFFDWYNQSLLTHGKTVLGAALNVFGKTNAPFAGIDIGAKIPGIHWRVGNWENGQIVPGDRLAEVTAGLIRTSRNDWGVDEAGRGYRPILSMFRDLQPLRPGFGNRVVPAFTAVEMPDGVDGPGVKSMPNTLAKWVGQEAARLQLPIKSENALNGNLSNNHSWDLMRSLLHLPNQHGYYEGITFLRMSDIVNDPTARARLSEITNAVNSMPKEAKPVSFKWGPIHFAN